MKEPYNTSRFFEHWNEGCKGCPPPPACPPDPKAQTLEQLKFTRVHPTTKPKKVTAPSKLHMPCPGLTAAYDEKVGTYLERSNAGGGGAHAIGHYSEKLFKDDFQNLSQWQQELAYAAQRHDHTLRKI
ncbi:hypothetical protein DFH06DRAFT_1343069 [Mycena polygramma]|nr:hypothetical protein DFH06DRAFT_1343069 [Mycena polygramma]